MPFDTTTVVHPAWSAHHQGAARGAMTARVVITDPSRTTPGEFDPDTGTWGPPTPHVTVGGPDDPRLDWQTGVPCRIQRQRDDRDIAQASQPITIRFYLLQLPADVPDIEVGHRAEVLECEHDVHLAGETLTVTDVMHGSERFTRDVMTVHNQAPPGHD